MTGLIRLLAALARHGRLLLVLGLGAGVALPTLAQLLKPHIQILVAMLLFLAALRIGTGRVSKARQWVRQTVGLVLVYQIAMPVGAIVVLGGLGLSATPAAIALILMLSASPVLGSPNLAILSGAGPEPAFRMMILGTALLPLTVLPVFFLMPVFGEASTIILAALRLLLGVGLAAGLGFLVRHILLPDPSSETIQALDGLSAIAMMVIVVGLMSAVGPALDGPLVQFVGWLALACGANLGMQVIAFAMLRRSPDAAPLAIVAGNRNIALFLVALPPDITDRILLFIGCYQVPMYLTPLLLARLYRTRASPLS